MEPNNLYYKMSKSPRILVVDDSATNNLLIQSILADQGYDAVIATNGKEALKYIYENNFDLILLDIMMPKMNGFEVLEKLKDDEEKKRIPVIVITAKVETVDVKKAIELGAVDYIKKPIDIDEIISRANMALRLKKISDESYIVEKLNDLLTKIIFNGFLNDHVNSIYSEKINKSQLEKTINSLISNEYFDNYLLNQYKTELSNVNIVDLLDKSISVFNETFKNKNIVLERNYSGEIINNTDPNLLMYFFIVFFNCLIVSDKTKKIGVSMYTSNDKCVIKVNDDNHNNKLESKFALFFNLLNLKFSSTANTISGMEYEIIMN